MNELIRRLKTDKLFMFEILLSSFFVNLLALATPIYVIQVLQRYVAYGVTATLITLVSGVILILVFEFLFRNLRNKISGEFEVINAKLSNSIYAKIHAIPAAFFALKDIRMSSLMKNMQTITNNLNGNNLLIFIDTPFSIIFLIAVYFLHYQLGLILTFFLIVPFIISNFLTPGITEKTKNYSKESVRQSILYHDSVNKNITIKYFKLISLAFSAWSSSLKNHTNSKGLLELRRNFLSSALLSHSALLTVVIIGWGAILSVNGELSVGALIGANILASRAIAPIVRFVQTSYIYKEVDTSIKEVTHVLGLPNEQIKGNEIANYSGDIHVSSLSMIYPQTKNPVFENINFEVSAGTVLCISGNNGAGKTSLIKTIIGILPFTRGKILFEKIEISQLSVNWLRQNISYMPQVPEFVDASLFHNISYGNNNIDKSIISKAINDADLSNFINTHPKGILMGMKNSNNNLPIGIIKRVAFARSLIGDGQIFVLDEPTEGMDKIGLSAVISKIKDLKQRGKTIIIASSNDDLINISDMKIDLNKKEDNKNVYGK